MIKESLVEAYKALKEENNLTYTDLSSITKLTRSQLQSILLHSGEKVSTDKMLEGLAEMGISVSVEFHNEE